MTIMISIKNGSVTHDVIVEPRDGKAEPNSPHNFSIAPGKKAIFSLWQHQTFLIREAGSYDRGVRMGDTIYSTLDEAINLLKKTLTIMTEPTMPAVQHEAIVNEIEQFVGHYTGGENEV